MTMQEGPSEDSPSREAAGVEDSRTEPGIFSLASLTDGRAKGDYFSRYPAGAWTQIIIELAYLLAVLMVSLHLLVTTALAINTNTLLLIFGYDFGIFPGSRPVLVWLVLGLSAAAGGASTSLKWLYHSVAKHSWNRDRVIWRTVVPVLATVLATFTGMMISAGLLPPIFNLNIFDSLIFNAGFGFFLGLFSDNLLAWLQRIALKTLGVVDRQQPGGNKNPEDS